MHNCVTSHLWLKSALHASSHPCMRTCVLRCDCFLLACPVLYFVPPFSFQPFLMFTSEFNERSRSNPLCDFRLGTVATSDHETPLTPPRRSLRQPTEACCTSPLEFSGHERGRLRGVLASIVSCIALSLNFGSLQSSAGPAQWSYDGGRRPTCGCVAHPFSSYRIARLGLCRVSLNGWLPNSIARTDEPIAPRFFNVSVHEWRTVVRRMVRCKFRRLAEGHLPGSVGRWRCCRA